MNSLRIIRYVLWGVVIVAAVAIAAVFLLRKEGDAPLIAGAITGGPFELVDQHGNTVTDADLSGHPSAMFFGYTFCPDICPTTLYEMTTLMEQLGPEADKLKVYFVTVDPERDTPELLAQYVPVFDARFLGLYGTAEKIAEVAKEFRVFYRKSGDLAGHYTIDHTAGTYVFGPDGRPRLYVKHAEDPQVVVADIKALLAGK